jgi:hypothetical protein
MSSASVVAGWLTSHDYSTHDGDWLSYVRQGYVMTDGQSAILSSCQGPSGAQDQIFITVRQLRVCWCGEPSLTRGEVYRLQLLLALVGLVTLGFERRENHDRNLLSQIQNSRNLEGQVPIFISPRNRVAQLYPQALASLAVASYGLQGYGGGIRTRLHTGVQ